MKITPVNYNTNQKNNNQQSFGMHFSDQVKLHLKSYDMFLSPESREIFQKLEEKKDDFALESLNLVHTNNFTISDLKRNITFSKEVPHKKVRAFEKSLLNESVLEKMSKKAEREQASNRKR